MFGSRWMFLSAFYLITWSFNSIKTTTTDRQTITIKINWYCNIKLSFNNSIIFRLYCKCPSGKLKKIPAQPQSAEKDEERILKFETHIVDVKIQLGIYKNKSHWKRHTMGVDLILKSYL